MAKFRRAVRRRGARVSGRGGVAPTNTNRGLIKYRLIIPGTDVHNCSLASICDPKSTYARHGAMLQGAECIVEAVAGLASLSARPHSLSAQSDKSNMRHMTEDALEQYVLRHLSETEVNEIEKHVGSCSRCQQQLASTKDFIDALRKVGGIFQPILPIPLASRTIASMV